MTIRIVLATIPVVTYALYSLNHTNKKNANFPGLTKVKANHPSLQLEQVQTLFRHGARTPIKSNEDFDNFSNLDAVLWDKERFMKVLPYVDIDYSVKSLDGGDTLLPVSHSHLKLLGGCIGAELTTTGQQEAYDFGKWLASEYITKHSLISSTYKSNEVYVRSTASKRAVLTAVGVMSGLYRKEHLQESVLIYVVPSGNICPSFSKCKKLRERFLYHWKVIKDGQEAINKTMGLKEDAKPFNFIEILDIIRSRKHHGLFVPEYLLDQTEQIEKGAMEVLLGILGSEHVDQLKNSIGAFVEIVCSRINEAIAGTCESKMILYSSHEVAIISFLIALGIFDNQFSPFVANVIIELYRGENNERYIRVLYNGNVATLDKEVDDEFLPVEKFMKLVEKYRVKNWAEDCGNEL